MRGKGWGGLPGEGGSLGPLWLLVGIASLWGGCESLSLFARSGHVAPVPRVPPDPLQHHPPPPRLPSPPVRPRSPPLSLPEAGTAGGMIPSSIFGVSQTFDVQVSISRGFENPAAAAAACHFQH